MKLWIDDVRPAPEGYRWVKSVHEAKVVCCQLIDPKKVLHIDEFNLDHDAGDYAYLGGDYIEFLKVVKQKVLLLKLENYWHFSYPQYECSRSSKYESDYSEKRMERDVRS